MIWLHFLEEEEGFLSDQRKERRAKTNIMSFSQDQKQNDSVTKFLTNFTWNLLIAVDQWLSEKNKDLYVWWGSIPKPR